MHEARALRLRADEAEKAEVAAPQDGFGDAQVQVVPVGEHEVEAAGRGVAHFRLHRVDGDAADVCRPAAVRER